MVEGVQKVEELSRIISEIATVSLKESQEVAAGAEEQSASIQEITASAYVLNEMSENLHSMLRRFKN
jgi:methyl-accepting chemotaxis protein